VVTPPPASSPDDRRFAGLLSRYRQYRQHYQYRQYPWPEIACGALAVVVNVLTLAGLRVPYLGPALGFWFLILLPVYLVATTSFWDGTGPAERIGYSLACVLGGLMTAGVLADLVLPLVGVSRPLDPVPVVLLADLLLAGLYLLRRRFPGPRLEFARVRAVRHSLRAEETRLLCGAALMTVLAVLGANRVNNDAGNQVSLIALGVAVLVAAFLLLWRQRVRELVILATLYLLSLGLLLMTSLRGWFVTGHDIQTEYQVFQLTQAHGSWQIAQFHNAYNACLSITILPAELADVLRVDGPYIYKLFFQLLFAACPVLVYAIARRYWSVPVAILGAIYFIGFPTFFTDMPFINRQEIGLLFVCVAVLAITSETWGVRRCRLTFLAACVGVEISHYSSMYIFLGILAVAWVVRAAMRVPQQARPVKAAHAEPPPWASPVRVVGIGSLLAVAVVTIGWGFLATQSAGAVMTDAAASISGLLGHSAGTRSSNVSYSLLFGHTQTPQQVLNDYNNSILKLRAATAGQTSYLERASVASQVRVKAVAEPLLPLTGAGRLLADAGIPVAGVNTAIRLAAAYGEQIFVVAGVIAFFVLRRLRRQVGWEFFCLCLGCVAVLGAVTVLPDLSVDYGILRVFQESLVLIAPVLVTGSIAIFRAFGEAWAPRIAAAVGVGILVSTTGLLPQVLGGYPAQLSLNNSGPYYNDYYVHPQEAAGTQWLSGQLGVLPSGVQATHAANRFLFTGPGSVTGQQFVEDAFPSLLRQHAWVILDYSILHGGLASVSYDGDIIPYKYPTDVLSDSKNLVYNNGGMQIYR
jgi:uncharacterized membrane protein